MSHVNILFQLPNCYEEGKNTVSKIFPLSAWTILHAEKAKLLTAERSMFARDWGADFRAVA